MDILYVTGNVCEASQKAMAHGCNAQGQMGKGVAKAVRDKWPNVYEIYNLRYRTFGLNVGEIIPVLTPDGKLILNCITQDRCRKTGDASNPDAVFVDYDAILKVFETINDKVIDWDVTEVAMPRIGAGLGGGDWAIISKIIEDTSTNYQPVVYDYAE